MFTATDSVATDYNFVVSPVEAGTVSSAGVFTMALDPGDELITVTATHKQIPSVTASTEFTGSTPKLTGLVISQVSNTVVVGAPTNPLATDSITITDPNVNGVVRVDGVPQGALTGELMYDVEGTDSGLMSLSLVGSVLTITLTDAITSEDTKVTIRTNPSSTVFRTYLVKSGPKPKTVVSVAIQPTEVPILTYGETVQFTGTVTYSDDSTDNDVLFVRPIGYGEIHGRNGLYTAPSRTIAEPFQIELWAGGATTIRAYATIDGVQPA